MNNFTNFFIILSIILSTLILITSFATAEERNFESSEFLISAEELNQMIEEEKENLKILDVRNSTKYLLGHLPRAVNMWDDDFTDPDGWVKGLIAKPGAFAAAAQEKGINKNSQIIVYDNNSNLWAARLWWVFKVYDHQNIKILEGGYDAWKNKGYETKILPHKNKKGNFIVSDVNNNWIVNSDTIAENLNNKDFVILDTRSEAEFMGEETNSAAPRKGRIPNAIHINWTEVLNDDYSFKSAAKIAEIYEANGITREKEVVALISHTGVRAAHTFFALKLLGYENLKLYDEAWVGWSNRSDLPLEKN
ncbi:Thiosulfate sulfurtransferase, rhodanese [Halanaerobium saccharolyticum subsp. saccharolyticum DSM 6643]|uniref:thiosulfate sulfurtransferase n=1 Tax=Halanaerobium saccharolyticum subsp. saccharolyticum DSM 6643 TaxID=1293054 RepID=M5EFY8_9FIRM|nr:sulfurtransferase [Halanaerobium saccharolyticum]CCU80144.1 Thiosulfate sulfurtransferase, rhodanese [Halanaerobium saccharolyticum subsp. saccharolyticum DSM 6643]